MRDILIDFAIDVMEQWGYPTGKRPALWTGGLSILEEAMDILYRFGVAKNSDKIFKYEIRRYRASQKT